MSPQVLKKKMKFDSKASHLVNHIWYTNHQRRLASISDVTINKDITTDSHFFGVVVQCEKRSKIVLCIIFENIVILSGVHM